MSKLLTRVKVDVPADGLNATALVQSRAVVTASVFGLERLLETNLDLLSLHSTICYLHTISGINLLWYN